MSFSINEIEIFTKLCHYKDVIDFEMVLKVIATVFLISSHDTGNQNNKTVLERDVYKIWVQKIKKEYEGRLR